MRKITIRKCDFTGDTAVDFDLDTAGQVELAQDKLTAFLTECVKQYGSKPPVWGRRLGQHDFDPFKVDTDNIEEVDQIVIHAPLVGG